MKTNLKERRCNNWRSWIALCHQNRDMGRTTRMENGRKKNQKVQFGGVSEGSGRV